MQQQNNNSKGTMIESAPGSKLEERSNKQLSSYDNSYAVMYARRKEKQKAVRLSQEGILNSRPRWNNNHSRVDMRQRNLPLAANRA